MVVTSSGLRAYVVPAAEDGVVQIVAALAIGRTREQPNEVGVSELVSRLLSNQVNERLGPGFTGRFQTDQDADLTRLSLQVLADDWRAGVAAVVSTLKQVRLDAAAIASYRTGPGYAPQTRGLGGAQFRPAIELARLVANHPVAPPPPGLSLPRTAVASMVSRTLRPAQVVLGIGGGVARAEVQRELELLTADWDRGTEAAAGAASATGVAKMTVERVRTFDEPGLTTWVALGHPMPPIAPGHEAAVAVMTDVVNVRLNIVAREIRGLANQVVLQVPATTRHGGLLHVRTGARAESIAPLLYYSRRELSRIREDDGLPTADELEQVKGGLVLGKWQGSLDGARAASATYAIEAVRYGSLDRLTRWPDAVRAVTAEDVRTVARTYVHPGELGAVIIGPLEAVRNARHPRWPKALDEVLPSPQPTLSDGAASPLDFARPSTQLGTTLSDRRRAVTR